MSKIKTAATALSIIISVIVSLTVSMLIAMSIHDEISPPFNEDQGASIMRQGIFIKTTSDQFVPAYLWYLFEARDIPRDIPVLFIDGLFNWYTDKEAGIIELRKESDLDNIEIKELGEKLYLEEEDENGVHLCKE